jgi:hypothetical protein
MLVPWWWRVYEQPCCYLCAARHCVCDTRRLSGSPLYSCFTASGLPGHWLQRRVLSVKLCALRAWGTTLLSVALRWVMTPASACELLLQPHCWCILSCCTPLPPPLKQHISGLGLVSMLQTGSLLQDTSMLSVFCSSERVCMLTQQCACVCRIVHTCHQPPQALRTAHIVAAPGVLSSIVVCRAALQMRTACAAENGCGAVGMRAPCWSCTYIGHHAIPALVVLGLLTGGSCAAVSGLEFVAAV